MGNGLSRIELEARLRDIDYRMAMDMRCPTMEVSAHRLKADAAAGVNPILTPDGATAALFYRVNYRIKTLIAEGKYSDPTHQPITVLVELNRNGNYPFSRPESTVIGPIIPWSPHFSRGLSVCFERPGMVWTSDGKKTVGHLLVHLARLVNFDETISDVNYGGYNGAAVRYWRSHLKSRPVTPDLAYPVLPAWLFAAPTQQTDTPREKARVASPAKSTATVVRRGA